MLAATDASQRIVHCSASPMMKMGWFSRSKGSQTDSASRGANFVCCSLTSSDGGPPKFRSQRPGRRVTESAKAIGETDAVEYERNSLVRRGDKNRWERAFFFLVKRSPLRERTRAERESLYGEEMQPRSQLRAPRLRRYDGLVAVRISTWKRGQERRAHSRPAMCAVVVGFAHSNSP